MRKIKSNSAHSRSNSRRCGRSGNAKLEILLVLAFLALLFQVFPALWNLLCGAADVRQWSRTTWMAMNVAIVLLLFGVRFGPNVIAAVRERWKQQADRTDARSAEATTASNGADYEARLRRDAEWAKRAKKRLPWQ